MLKMVSCTTSSRCGADSLTTYQAYLTFLPYSSLINRIISAVTEKAKAAYFRADFLQIWLVALVVVLIRYLLNFQSSSDGTLLCFVAPDSL